MNMLDPQCLMEAIERNFNGYQDYENVCQQFLQAVSHIYLISMSSAFTYTCIHIFMFVCVGMTLCVALTKYCHLSNC